MRIRFRRGSWILFVLAIVGFVFPSVIAATAAQESTGPILATFYDNFGYNSSPPLPDESGRPIVGTTSYFEIDQNFDANAMFGLYEDFIVKYEGHITSPITGDIIFWPWADDGTQFILDGTLMDPGNWVDKGGGGNQTSAQSFVAGVSKPFTYWYYENGGRSMDKTLLGHRKWVGNCSIFCLFFYANYNYNSTIYKHSKQCSCYRYRNWF